MRQFYISIMHSCSTGMDIGLLAYHGPKPTNWRLGHIADGLQDRLASTLVLKVAAERVVQEHPAQHPNNFLINQHSEQKFCLQLSPHTEQAMYSSNSSDGSLSSSIKQNLGFG